MNVLWNYLKPHRWLVALSLLLAGASQVLTMLDPLIFGKIIDDFTSKVHIRASDKQVKEVLFWLLVATGIALLARLSKAIQE